MKQIAFLSLVTTLFISQFHILGASTSNNTLAIALMLLILVVFSDLAKFSFWGIRSKRREEELKELTGKAVIANHAVKPPSPYKVREAEKLDLPAQMNNSRENFLSLSFEIERLLRIIARSTSRKMLSDAAITPQLILTQLKSQRLLTKTAVTSIEKIREVRSEMMSLHKEITPEILEAAQALAAAVYTEFKTWLEQSRSGKA